MRSILLSTSRFHLSNMTTMSEEIFYRNVVPCKLRNILLEMDHVWAMITDEHDLNEANVHKANKSLVEI